ncbi:MAG TPA: tetratricopeptide repeat protein [Spirochaetota bacterium]|nr:tetratricopeptide repeat protein [Spirochaetota bacterium]
MTEVDINVRIRKFLSSALRDIGAGNYDGAIEHLRAAEVLDPENPETLFNLGISYCRKEMFLEAIDLFSKVIALPRSSVDILTVLKLISYCLVRLESYEQALVHAGEGLSSCPTIPCSSTSPASRTKSWTGFPRRLRITGRYWR